LPAAPPFDYDGIPALTATTLRAQAARIRDLVKTHTSAVIEAGLDLIAVKQHLEHGQFSNWVLAEFNFSLATAENYMRAARFAEGKISTVTILQPATVYRLAAKSTPPEIVESVMERASRGEVVSDRQVLAAIEESRFQKREAERKSKRRSLSKAQLARQEKRRREFEQASTRRRDAAYDAALSILAEVGTEKVKFILGQMFSHNADTFEIVTELKKQIGAGVAR
jgi:hypothetical protein